MNKDVFGDGINVQGIEEVPTQMVLKKKYKTKKMTSNMEAKNVNSDLAKLKKQGIVIKAKSSKTTPILAVLKKQTDSQNSNINPPVTSSPSDVLSKLLSHGNSEIKIVKKSIQMDTENKQDGYQSNKIDSSSDYDKSLQNTSQTITKENENVKENCEDSGTQNILNKLNIENKDNIADEDNELAERANDDTQEDFLPEQNMTSLSEKDLDDLNSDKNQISDIEETVGKINIPLKNLQNMGSQLTIKPLNQTKNQITMAEQEDFVQYNNMEKEIPEKSSNDIDDQAIETENSIKNNTLKSLNLQKGITIKAVSKNNTQPSTSVNENQEKKIEKLQQCTTPSKSLEALKGLSKFITVKPSSSSPSSNHLRSDNCDLRDKMSDDENSNQDIDTETVTSHFKQQLSDKKVMPAEIQTKEDRFELKTNTDISDDSQKHANILKRLTNVTAKSISTLKNIPTPNKTMTPNPKIVSKETASSKNDNVIEILNIDDSDSDADVDNVVKPKQNYISKPLQNPNKTSIASAPIDALRGVSKNITIKSMSQQSSNYTEYQSKAGQGCKKTVINRSYETKNINITQGNNKLWEEQKNLQKTINNLRRHITIKSKNSLPSNSDFQSAENINDAGSVERTYEDEEHDSDSSTGRVKITELNEEHVSDTENQNNEDETRVRVESPHSSNSCDEERQNEDIGDDFTDIESQIKANPIINTNQSLKTNIQPQKSSKISHLNELTIKPVRQGNLFLEDEINTNDKTSDTQRNVTNVPGKSANPKQINKNVQSNQKANTSANQMSTVKTVKTYQSQTVIEEVTTTVTKTIRTVNRQEVQNSSQVISRPTIRPQKIMNKSANNIKATPIRQASPAIGTKVKHSMPTSQNMSSTPSTIRPSNMLVPARPRLNSPRTPNTSNIRKTTPAQNQPRFPCTSNRLKISPHITNNAKRQSEEASGHFSCFKKPKESLIPVQDLPHVSDDGTMQYSCSQSKKTFSNVTKVSKDNTLASTSQTKTESSTSQQHIAKLSGMTGIKIVKTSSQQSKQVEEKCEVNSPKNDTIAALEKLQRQGLLIKKPRVETSDYENNSFSGSDGETYEE